MVSNSTASCISPLSRTPSATSVGVVARTTAEVVPLEVLPVEPSEVDAVLVALRPARQEVILARRRT